jgi:hypothetical protein
MTMQFHLRRSWRELSRGRPGHRFQDRYQRAHQKPQRGGVAQRILLVVVAIFFLAIGVVLSVMPGPAFVFYILAGGLLASESRYVARFMDASEVIVRKVLRWGKRKWSGLPIVARGVLVLIAIGCAVGAAFIGYRLMRG